METTSTLASNPPTSASHPLLVIERLLREREVVWQQIRNEYRINELIGQMLSSSMIALFCYGLTLGLSNGWLQALASAIKLPLLFLLTLAICLPTLYYFNLVFGARLSVRQALALVLTAITVTAVLTLAFAPISLFFLLTAPDYDFYKTLNVAILTLTGFIGLGFLLDGMRNMNELLSSATAAPKPAAPPEAPAEATTSQATPKAPAKPTPAANPPVNMNLLYIWVVLYGFVGTQLAWTLRPFFGDPGQPFEIFRRIEGNFYVNIYHTLVSLFS
ncbi:MAG: hypothetical protein MUD01_10590 [Chloroflexaceae bacterium]|jgi:hypothetical protein|nr:hypothetical protein [Chloroflexaceae bacterium]